MKYILVVLSTVFLLSCNSIKGQSKQIDSVNVNIDYNEYIKKTKKQQVFKKDLVVNEDMAIKLANIYWDSRYGSSKVIRDLPFTVILEDNKVWYVKTNLPKEYVGRVLHIKINKNDGKILNIWSEG